MLLLSIITVNRNDREGLLATESSIRSQLPSDFEWIVVDGASTDGSVDVLRQSEVSQLHWTSEPDIGIYDAMNKGIRMARGRFMLFLNSGDILDTPGAISLIEQSVEQFGDDTMIAFASRLVSNGQTVGIRRALPAIYLLHGMPAIHQSMIYPAAAVAAGYDADLKCCGDYQLTATAWHTQGVKYVRQPNILTTFSLGGFSSENGDILCREARLIQQEVLGLPKAVIAVSHLLRRLSISRQAARAARAMFG